MKHIDNAISLMDAGKTGKKIDLTGGFTIEISYDNFIINKRLDKVPEFEYNIALNEITHIKEVNKTLLARVFEAGTETWEDIEDKDSFCVDFDLVKGSLTVRNRRPGDSITPCGMEGSKKVKDVFIDLKIPKEERDSRLIVADDENIIWLEGYRINDKYKINESTKKILKISTGRQYEQRH